MFSKNAKNAQYKKKFEINISDLILCFFKMLILRKIKEFI